MSNKLITTESSGKYLQNPFTVLGISENMFKVLDDDKVLQVAKSIARKMSEFYHPDKTSVERFRGKFQLISDDNSARNPPLTSPFII